MIKLIAWCGGGVFVASLILTAWWYFVALGRQEPAAVSGAALSWNAALVTAFALHHSLFARDAIKRRLAVVPDRLLRSFYVWIASTLLIAVVLLWQPVGGELYRIEGVAAWLFVAVQLAGLSVMVKAVAGLDPLELAGIRQASGSVKPAAPLLDTGVYGLVRHPLYLGWLVLFFAVPHLTGDRLAFAALTSLYLLAAVPLEERSLRKSFGDEYVRYAEKVRWRIVPFIY